MGVVEGVFDAVQVEWRTVRRRARVLDDVGRQDLRLVSEEMKRER